MRQYVPLWAELGREGREDALALQKYVFWSRCELGTVNVVQQHILLVIARAEFIHVRFIALVTWYSSLWFDSVYGFKGIEMLITPITSSSSCCTGRTTLTPLGGGAMFP